ncbi:histidinol-phosphate transaminase [Chitinispirillales bacterium ANBcel5]|uniref:histidinol-phosphate transaminase n=1 Tax=Cellulosispirillum alkaliphilum TaxID=3039283 RepID=UPI002A580753|nr:histidinol-phosphate transaminase [Chitinispirillales bacterium ANBcel5]
MKIEDAVKLVNSSVRSLKKYHLTPEESQIKLNQNENPCDWTAEIKELAAKHCIERPWNRYPDFIPLHLKDDLARYTNVESENIIVGNGSNEMLMILMLSFLSKSSTAIMCTPTFTVYNLLVNGLGAAHKTVNLKEDLQYDVPAICDEVKNNPGSILILCSPNNPTGSVLSKQQLTEILEVHSGICILDQAYIEFGGFNGIELIKSYPNLIVTRTFSKALGAAGLRLGYMIADKELIEQINKIKLPYNINFFSEYCASLILQNRSKLNTYIDTTIKEREELITFLNTLPFDNVYPSEANFVLVRSSQKQQLFDYLKENGILVRDVSSSPMLEGCLRLSLGKTEENDRLKGHIKSFFEK